MTKEKDLDPFIYVMACEKMVSMLSLIDQTMQFMVEYGVKPDEEAKKYMKHAMEIMKKWCDTKDT